MISDVIVTNTMYSDNGLLVQLYVQSVGEVISQQVVIDAVNVRNGTLYLYVAHYFVCGLLLLGQVHIMKLVL